MQQQITQDSLQLQLSGELALVSSLLHNPLFRCRLQSDFGDYQLLHNASVVVKLPVLVSCYCAGPLCV